MKYQVTADIRYIDGTLAGLTIPAGFRANFVDNRAARRCIAWLLRTMNTNDFVRATGTGNRYNIVGRIAVDRLAS